MASYENDRLAGIVKKQCRSNDSTAQTLDQSDERTALLEGRKEPSEPAVAFFVWFEEKIPLVCAMFMLKIAKELIAPSVILHNCYKVKNY